MENVLFWIGGIPVYAFGFMLGLGILSGSSLALREARRRGIGMERMSDFVLGAAVVFLLAGRIAQSFHSHGWHFLYRPWVLITELFQGVQFFAGFLAVVLYSFWFVWDRKMMPTVFLDALTPPIALTLALSQLGLDVFGRSSDLFWAVSLGEFRLHPVQLYAAIGFYTIFTLLWRLRRATRYDGQLFVSFAVCSAWLFWALSYVREVGERSTSPWVPFLLAVAATGAAAYLYIGTRPKYKQRRRRAPNKMLNCLWGTVFYLIGMIAMIVFFYVRVR